MSYSRRVLRTGGTQKMKFIPLSAVLLGLSFGGLSAMAQTTPVPPRPPSAPTPVPTPTDQQPPSAAETSGEQINNNGGMASELEEHDDKAVTACSTASVNGNYGIQIQGIRALRGKIVVFN